MKTLVSKNKSDIDKTLGTLIDELEEECIHVVHLIKELKAAKLSKTQRDDILGELSASLSHLKTHSGEVEQTIDECP